MARSRTGRTRRSPLRKRRRQLLALALLVPAASCVPKGARLQSAGSLATVLIDLPAPAPAPALRADASAALDPGQSAASTIFHARTALDGMRALDCLAEAVYYEARSESDAGQRAVAQTVLNRVRHPAYPASVCGVVYQGPMKPGGGCQFTFTCDGSLAYRPVEPGWSRARRIAAEALAGKVFRPVGLATHYHTRSVQPDWASALTKSAVIGAHIFYRWNGAASAPVAFGQAYSGREPARIRPAPAILPPVLADAPTLPAGPPPHASPDLLVAQAATDRLPQSRVRPEYRNSGAWKLP